MPESLKHTYGIRPFEGKYDAAYTYKMWVDDVVVHAKYHFKNQPYFQGAKKNNLSPPILTVITILLFALVAYLYSFHRKRLNLLLRTFVNWKVAKQVIRYEKVYTHPVNVLLYIVFIIGSAIFYALAYRETTFPDLNLFYASTAIIVFVLFYFTLKLFLYKSSAWLFNIEEIVEEYIFQSNFFNKIFGLINLILLVLLLYSPIGNKIIVVTSFIIFVLFSTIQLVRGFFIGMQKSINLRLIILYLCTLEILPWFIIGKWIKNIL